MGLEILTDVVRFTQSTPSASWVITHNLGTQSPVIDCWVDNAGNKEKILPATTEGTTVNICTITFSSPIVGEAVLS